MSEYKEAEEWISQQYCGKTIYDGHPLDTIHKALRIADKLMQGPSDGVLEAMGDFKRTDDYEHYGNEPLFNTIRAKLIAEVEEDMHDIADAEKAYAETTRFWTQE